MTKRALIGAALAASLLAGCVGLAGCGRGAGGGGGVGMPGVFQSNTVIDWVDSVRFDGVSYLAANPGRSLQSGDLGAQFTKVSFQVAENAHDPNYRMRDGDATYLAAGTPIYRVNDYAPTFRLAARSGDHVILYEADTNPRATVGGDLLDIGGRVRVITVTEDTQAAHTVATISDSLQVRTLVTLLLSAPVNQQHDSGDGPRYFLTFALNDGTQVARVYMPEGHEVGRGIIVPPAFVSMLTALGV